VSEAKAPESQATESHAAGSPANPHAALVPYVAAADTRLEWTWRAVILGVLMAFIFNAANAYVGLKIGLTVSASIPSAVISMGLLRKFLPRLQRMFGVKNASPGTILENNTAHAIASTGEALAAGIIFTVPSFYFLTAHMGAEGYPVGGKLPGEWETFAYGAIGGLLGLLAMIPLRQYLVVAEHGKLPFPEGVACAKVLIAGDQGGVSAKPVFYGILTGTIGKFLMSGVGLWRDTVWKTWPSLHKATLGFETSPLLAGVGYLIGARIAAVMLAGSMLGYVVLIPFMDWLAQSMCVAPGVAGDAAQAVVNLCHPIAPATKSILDMSANEMRGAYIKYIGAGGVAFGGAWSIVRTMPQVGTSIRSTFAALQSARANKTLIPRTERDLSFKTVGVVLLGLVVAILCLPTLRGGAWGFGVTLLMAALAVTFAFFFVAVSARTVGLIGATSQPVSGMTITAVLASSLIISALGYTDLAGQFAAMTIGALVCISICLSGDMAQDLKTGALIGATPRYIQLGQIIGVVWAALRAGAILLLLHAAYKLGSPKLEAPQASLMANLVQGAMGGSLPWALLGLGAGIGIIVEMCGLSALAFSIGLYLPISTWPPIVVGGIVAWLVQRRKGSAEQRDGWHERGTLFASGLVAGDALMGIGVSLLAVLADQLTKNDQAPFAVPLTTWGESYGAWTNILPLFAFAVFCVLTLRVAWAKER
jgi:putative OPT family oligopeptide transporter